MTTTRAARGVDATKRTGLDLMNWLDQACEAKGVKVFSRMNGPDDQASVGIFLDGQPYFVRIAAEEDIMNEQEYEAALNTKDAERRTIVERLEDEFDSELVEAFMNNIEDRLLLVQTADQRKKVKADIECAISELQDHLGPSD